MISILLAVIIPAYNERDTIETLINRVRAEPTPKRIVVVDDASTDGTRDILDRLASEHDEIMILTHETNRGKGAAIRTAIPHADADVVLIQDADLEYDPAEYARLIGPIIDGRADAVLGSRFVGGEPHRVLYFWHSLGNRLITLLSNTLTNLNLTDVECCYKAFRRETLAGLVLREDRFGIEPEIVAKLARAKARVFEVGVSYAGRTYAEGKKITWRDGLSAVRCILRYNIFR